jgi:beta-lactam-binding protein with PASTA domain/tRNA A-37 threonylcarbamoyl transferase component Bud32
MTSTTTSGGPDDHALVYNGRYELMRQIARGGTAQVYLARDLLLDRPVALKVLFPELSTDPSFVERFRREAQAAANLSHPNIVPVFDWGESERTYFIVMEFVDGEPLSSIIRSQAPLPAARAAGIAADISKALSYAHRHGVIHRDIKPGNVLITRDGQVKVTDFGIARAVGTDDNVTQTGLVMGTATYFSPEQAQGLGVDGRSDVYALGVVLYEMVTARPPFSADTPVAIAYKHVSEAPVPPSELEPRVPVALEAIILHAIAKQPYERYATADDFYADLQRYAQGAPVLAGVAGAGAGVLATQAIIPGIGGATGPGTTQPFVPGATTTPGNLGGSEAVAPIVEQESELVGGRRGRPELPKRRWIGWTLALLILAAALAFLVYTSGRALGYFGASGYFHMPDELGQKYLTADSQLHGTDGLSVRLVPVHSTVAQGTVMRQSPATGTLVRRGETVRLVYSLGPTDDAVPPVTGDPVAAAEAAITRAGLTPKVVAVAPTSPTQQPGVVVTTNPIANTPIPPHSPVTLYVITGSYHQTIPSVAGDTVAQAQQALYAKHFVPGQVIYQPSGTVPSGKVSGTNPAAGISEPIDTTVEIIVSQGPPATVPPVVGDLASQAEALVIQAGLNYRIVYVAGLPSDVGYVASVDPTAGTEEPKGYIVTLSVVQSPGTTTTTTTSGGTTTTTTSNPGVTTTTKKKGRTGKKAR